MVTVMVGVFNPTITAVKVGGILVVTIAVFVGADQLAQF